MEFVVPECPLTAGLESTSISLVLFPSVPDHTADSSTDRMMN